MKTLVKKDPISGLLAFIPEVPVQGLSLTARQIRTKPDTIMTLCTVQELDSKVIGSIPAFAPAIYETTTGLVPTPDAIRQNQAERDRPIDPALGDYALNSLIEFANSVNGQVLLEQNIASVNALFDLK